MNNPTLTKYAKVFLVAISLLCATYMIFFKLDGFPIYIWDEAIYANNAIEMVKSGDPIVLKVDNVNSTYNSKPPLVIWAQALCIKVFGPNELAIRLPSALAALGTCIVLLLFSHKTLNNIVVGAIAVIVLTTTPGYIRNHLTRTGDLDSVLVFWITLYTCLALHYIIHRPPNYKKYFSLITLFIVLGFYSKSIAALLPLPGLFLATFVNHSTRSILKIRFLYVCALIGAICCIAFYVIRELIEGGYIEVVLFSEYLRYFKNIMPWHEQPFYHYFTNLYTKGFLVPYLFILPFLIYAAVKDVSTKAITLMLLIFTLSFMIVISVPKNRLEWYDAPIYPFISLIMAIGAFNAIRFLYLHRHKTYHVWALATIIFIAFITWSFSITYKRINHNNNVPFVELEREGIFMRELHFKRPDIKDYSVVMHVEHEAHLTHARWYAAAYNMSDNANLSVLSEMDSIKSDHTYLFCQDTVKAYIHSNFNADTIATNGIGCNLVRLSR